MLEWHKLLNKERRRKSDKNRSDQRNPFERDYDRVIYCSSFRRLKDKAQVFPLERDDFVRTRLAHSLEVSTLGRSFGTDVFKTLKKRKRIKRDEVDENEIAAILSTVCLLHDIGNPPFGHFGEESIRSWFTKFFSDHKPSLSVAQRKDFENFEGNAQAFRIATYTQFLRDEMGLNLTYGTLASLIKYPCSSTEFIPKGPRPLKKFGYFQTEKDVFEDVIKKNGIEKLSRHPLAFLMEAADDIAYSAIDIEDALRKKEIPCHTFIEYMGDNLKDIDEKKLITKFKKKRDDLRKTWGNGLADSIAIQEFRIESTGIMFRACVNAFCENYSKIMECDFSKELIKASTASHLYSTCQDFARKYVYVIPSVLSLEILGCKVIHGLLDFFVKSVHSGNRNNQGTEEGKLFLLISPGLRKLVEKYKDIEHEDIQYHLATDFISGMTDNHALNLYQNLSGIRIGGIK
ncbi:MAG: dGTP triphosphohydrolase [Bacteroidota bacterium]|jgi:dGTPase